VVLFEPLSVNFFNKKHLTRIFHRRERRERGVGLYSRATQRSTASQSSKRSIAYCDLGATAKLRLAVPFTHHAL